MEDLIKLVNKLPEKPRNKIFPLISQKIDEIPLTVLDRQRISVLIPKDLKINNINYNQWEIGISIAGLFLELGNFEIVKNLAVKYGDYTAASLASRRLDKIDEAKQYILRIFENFHSCRTGFFSMDLFLSEAREVLSVNELEELLINGFEGFMKEHKKTNDYNFQCTSQIFKAFVAKEKGQNEEIEEIFNNNKEKIEECRRKIDEIRTVDYKERDEDDSERLMNLSESIDDLDDFNARLNLIIGKEEEALRYYMNSIYYSNKIFDEQFSSIVEKIDKEELKYVYERILRNSINHTSPPDFFHAALATEKLDDKESSMDYYRKALIQMERRGWFKTAFKIAKKLNLDDKVNLYVDLGNELYSHRII